MKLPRTNAISPIQQRHNELGHICVAATEDLKVGRFSHADAGQMHMYLNYAREHWTLPGENPPVGLILAASKGEAEAHYALEGLSNQVLAAEYQTALPSESVFAEELTRTQAALAAHRHPPDDTN